MMEQMLRQETVTVNAGHASTNVEHRRTEQNQAQGKHEAQCENPWCEQWHIVSIDDSLRINSRESREETFHCSDLGRVCPKKPHGWTEAKKSKAVKASTAATAKLILNLHEAHSFCHNSLRGHVKDEALTERVKNEFPHLNEQASRRAAIKFIKGCAFCQKNARHNNDRKKHPGRPTSSSELLKHFVMDHVQISSEPDLQGNTHVLAFICAFSCFPILFACQGTTAKEAAGKLTELSLRFGIPKTISTDKGSAFTSELFTEMIVLMSLGIRFANSARPQAIGKIERSHQNTLTEIKSIIGQDKTILRNWSKHLSRIESTIASKHHRAIGMAPVQLVYANQVDTESGRRFGDDDYKQVPIGKPTSEYLKQLNKDVNYFQRNASAYLSALENDARAFQGQGRANLDRYNEARHPNEVKTQSYEPQDLILIQDKPLDKTRAPWKGPVQVTRHDANTSTVDFSEIARDIHGKIHVSRTKPWNSSHGHSITELQSIAGADHGLFVPLSFNGSIIFPPGKTSTAKNATIEVNWLEGPPSIHPAIDFKANTTFRVEILAKEERDVQDLFKVTPQQLRRPAVQRREVGESHAIEYDDIPAIGHDIDNAVAAVVWDAAQHDWVQSTTPDSIAADPRPTALVPTPTPRPTSDESVAKTKDATKPKGFAMRASVSVPNKPETSFAANVLFDTGATACDVMAESVANQLAENGATVTFDSTRIVGYDSNTSASGRKINATVTLIFDNKDIAITSTWIVTPKLTTDIIIGDGTCAKAGLVKSDIKELQVKLDIAAATSHATIEINSINSWSQRVQEQKASLHTILATQPSDAYAGVQQYSRLERRLARLQLQYDGNLIEMTKLNQYDHDEDLLPKPHALPDFVRNTTPPTPPPLLPSATVLLSMSDSQLKQICDQPSEASKCRINADLTTHQMLRAKALVHSFGHVFACTLGSSLRNVPPMELQRKDEFSSKQLWCYPRPTTPETKGIIKETLAEMLAAGIIRRSVKPILTSPVHIVRYKDKKPRFTIG